MKVLFLADMFLSDPDAVVTGTMVQILMIGQELSRRGHEVRILAGTASEAPLAGEYGGIPVDYYPRRRRAPWIARGAILRRMAELAPDVVYVRGRSYLVGVAGSHARRSGAALVWATNGEDGCERWKGVSRTWSSGRSFVRKVLRTPIDAVGDMMCHRGIRRADAVVNQTAHQAERLRVVWGREGTIVRTLQSWDGPLPPKDDPPMVLWIGRVAPYRGPEAFVRLACALSGCGCRFVMAGPAPDESYLRAVLQGMPSDGTFEYTGPIPFEESWRLIARASVLVNTSVIEGVSNALVQAWTCGTPTVVVSLDPDGLIAASGAGLVSGDEAGLAEDVRRLVGDAAAREQMGRRGRELAEAMFTPRAVGDAYESLLDTVVPRG